jgi:hypothetical protein
LYSTLFLMLVEVNTSSQSEAWHCAVQFIRKKERRASDLFV